jgi:formamidopyrimidine-DNA glycosylase
MPELPEVETVRAGLNKLLPGKVVKGVSSDWPKSFPNDPALVDKYLINAKVELVRRRAKVLIIELSSEYSLVIHLKMTGQLVYRDKGFRFGAGHPNDSLVGNLPDRSTHVELTFIDNSKLFFNDQRKFGWVRLLPTAEVMHLDFFKKVGPEPLEPEFTWQVFRDRLTRRKNSGIKAVLLDQSVLAGVGNIYADESLWAAKIHPATLVKDISPAKIKLLHKVLIDVLELSIAKGGSTDKNYVNAEGIKGSYIDFAKVFRREGQHCFRCNHEIKKIRVAGRGTHICPYCQPKPKASKLQ